MYLKSLVINWILLLSYFYQFFPVHSTVFLYYDKLTFWWRDYEQWTIYVHAKRSRVEIRLLSYAPCVHKSYIIDNTVIRKFSTPNFSVVVWMRYHEIWYSLKYITISTWKSTVFHKISKINLTTLKILILGWSLIINKLYRA